MILFQKAWLFCFTQTLMSRMLTQIQKGGLYPSKLLPFMTVFSVSILLQVIVTENSWLGDASLKVYKIIWKTNRAKLKQDNNWRFQLYFGQNGQGWRKIKHKNVIDVTPIFALSKFIMDNGQEDLWRRENPEISEFTHYDRSSCTGSRIDRVYTDKKLQTIAK